MLIHADAELIKNNKVTKWSSIYLLSKPKWADDWLGWLVSSFTCTGYHILTLCQWCTCLFLSSCLAFCSLLLLCIVLPACYHVPFKSNLKSGLFHVLYTVISCQISICEKLQFSVTHVRVLVENCFFFLSPPLPRRHSSFSAFLMLFYLW